MDDMPIDLFACAPPPVVIEIPAPEPGAAGEVLQFLTAPLQPLREQFIAITGAGLETAEPEGFAPARHRIPANGDGIELSYISRGNPAGRRIVFIHGSPGVAEEWGAFLADVPPGQYRLAADRPGFGETLPQEPVPSLAAQARSLAPLLGDGPGAIVVGYSFGGPVALRLAADYPDKVAGILLIGSAADPAAEEIHPLQEAAALEMFAQLLPVELHNSNTELLALRAELETLAGDLDEITAPVTIVQGLQDTLVPPQSAEYLGEMLQGPAGPRQILIEGGDHFLPWTHPETLKLALRCVLRDADQS